MIISEDTKNNEDVAEQMKRELGELINAIGGSVSYSDKNTMFKCLNKHALRMKSLVNLESEVHAYIDEYVKSKNGECVDKHIFGIHVIANHLFTTGPACDKCGFVQQIFKN